jgi:signal transduction histidine kinase
MVFIFITYIAFGTLLIFRNYKSKNIYWFYAMLLGFCLAFIGLASFTEFLYSVNYTESKLFKGVSQYIWMYNYYLQLDVLTDFRIMNVGVALYIYGALCFPLSYMSMALRKWGAFFLALLPVALILVYDPETLKIIYGVDQDFFRGIANKRADEIIRISNYLFYWLIKLNLVASIGIWINLYRKIVPILRKKIMYMFIGIVPIHLLFLVLFYWYPNNVNKAVFIRYNPILNTSIPYNKFLYDLITLLGVASLILMIYAMFKYNIFEINVQKDRVSFQRKFDTAHIGLNVFSHSIKNQFIAMKLLAEQLTTVDQVTAKKIAGEIADIASSSIEKLSSLSREMGKIRLKYQRTNVSQLLSSLVQKYRQVNSNYHFILEVKEDVYLDLDVKHFEKVVDNIILNAVEAGARMQDSFIGITLNFQNDYGIICIYDNGTGIDEKDVKKVFDPFYSTKPTSSNWGIGLSYCQKVVEAFGGVIDINSKLGQGTTVEIYIPISKR